MTEPCCVARCRPIPSSVTALRHAVADFVVAAGVGEPVLTGVKLAVSEAVTNVVVHAYVGAERPGEVRVPPA